MLMDNKNRVFLNAILVIEIIIDDLSKFNSYWKSENIFLRLKKSFYNVLMIALKLENRHSTKK